MDPGETQKPTVPAPPTVLEMERRPTVPWRPPRELLQPVPEERERSRGDRPAPRSRERLGPIVAVVGAVVLGGVLAVPVADALLGAPDAQPLAAATEADAAPRPPVAVADVDGRGETLPAVTFAFADEPVVVDRRPSRSTAVERPARSDHLDRRLPGREPTPTPDASDAPGATSPREALRERVIELHRLLPDLAAADVERLVRNQRPRMRRCYDRALRRNGGARDARLTLTVDVAPTGEVEGVQIRGDAIPELADCLEDLARRWSFPPSRGGARVPIPLAFSTAD